MARSSIRLAGTPNKADKRRANFRNLPRMVERFRMLERTIPAPDSSTPAAGSAQPIIRVADLSKTYATGFQALKGINLDIRAGEIFALLGPNGAGKTTLIGIICGIVTASAGRVTVAGRDIVRDFRAARAMIGLVPQELHTDAFESVWNTVSFSRGLWGKRANPAHI